MPLILSRPRIVQPIGPVGVNRRHPLTRGLVSLICPGSGLEDWASGRVGASAGLRHALTATGKTWSLDGTASTVIDLGGMPPGLPDLSGTYTLAAIVIPDGTSAVGPFIRLYDGARSIQVGYVVNNGWMGLQSSVSNSSRAVSVSSAWGKFHTIIGSHANGADLDTYVNGSSLGKAGAMGASLTTAGYFLNNPDITATTAKVQMVAIWNRFLTVEEKAAIHAQSVGAVRECSSVDRSADRSIRRTGGIRHRAGYGQRHADYRHLTGWSRHRTGIRLWIVDHRHPTGRRRGRASHGQRLADHPDPVIGQRPLRYRSRPVC
jgi:hypothetical protein